MHYPLRTHARPLPLLRACHLAPTLAVTLGTTALALGAGRGHGTVAVAAAVLCGQLTVGWANDLLDRHRDRLAGRTDKPLATGELEASTVRAAALTAGVACVPLSFLSGWRAAVVHLAAVGVALAYDAGVKATVASPLPYVAAFGSLPVFVTLGLDGHPMPAWWAPAAGALLGLGAHFVNTLPDLETDRRLGVWGLPQRLGAPVSLAVGAGALVLAVAVLALAPAGAPGPLAAAVAGAAMSCVAAMVVAARRGRARTAWHLSLAVAGSAVALFLPRGTALTP